MTRRAIDSAITLLATTFFLTNAFAQTPIIDMTPAERYEGLQGGRYPGGANTPPPNHDAEGKARAAGILPIGGKVVLLAIGLSNSEQEWCGVTDAASLPCNSWTFTGQAEASTSVNHDDLVIVNGALPAQGTDAWDEPTDQNYARIELSWLTPLGITPDQVRAVQMLEMTGLVFDGTSGVPRTPSLPDADANAYFLVQQYGAIARTLKEVYPNLEMIFVSPRGYGGYGTSRDGNANPEPYAYEVGFASKLFIQAQLTQCPTSACTGPIDPLAGDLSYASGTAPWITWGAYLWADGAQPNSEGLFYLESDYEPNGQHPTQSGETKIGSKLLDFYLGSPYATPWFAAGGTTPSCTDDHTCLVASDISLRARGRSLQDVTASVQVVNDQGLIVRGAAVTATWTLPDGSHVDVTASTDSTGDAELTQTGPNGTYTLQITDIEKTGMSFDSADSVLTKTIRAR